ncbi:peptidoglycan DD-metalloendopeptidase family protein [Patescibacteria group bacterium]|nr:peptidoglycan DD-metalloendopeptidase family protein [Patescibacteria group bacterium]
MKLMQKYIAILSLTAFALTYGAFSAFAEESGQIEKIFVTDIQQDEVSRPPLVIDPQSEADKFLEKLKTELNMSKSDYHQVLKKAHDTEEKLEQITHERVNLEAQLQYLERSLSLTTEKLFDVLRKLAKQEVALDTIQGQIIAKQNQFEDQKSLLKDYMRILYQEENALISIDDNGELDAIKLLFTEETIGENLKELKYFDILNETGRQMLDDLSQTGEDLLYYKELAKKEKIKLDQLKASLKLEKEELEAHKIAKENLLKISAGQEQIYTQLLEQSMEEQEGALDEIKKLIKVIADIEQHLQENGEFFDEAAYIERLDDKSKALYNFQLNYIEKLEAGSFLWPVEPERGISAYFHDPSYSSFFGVGHNAIDLPVPQGSFVRATSNGVVFTARDNGYGYSYIIIAHGGGFQTVYGHMSKILVKEGQAVGAGAVIGLSGGMPGTLGAGYMTTGPHLHFEMLRNGIYVDPLGNLPLENLSREHLESLPEKYLDLWEEQALVPRTQKILREVRSKVE